MNTPPLYRYIKHASDLSSFNKKLLSTLLLVSISQIAFATHFEDTGTDKLAVLTHEDGALHEYDSIIIEHTPPITQNQFSILLKGGSDINVQDLTSIRINATKYVDSLNGGEGNYAIAAYADSDVNLLGDVDIFVYQRDDSGQMDTDSIGANGIWLENANATVGSSTSRTKIWTFAAKPDTIQLKKKSTFTINSTDNQIVGNILVEKDSSLSGKFIGNGYFSGDDFSLDDQNWVGWIGDLSDGREKYTEGSLNLSFENGAQWIYLKLPFITSITLNNDGVINLYDQDIP